MLRFGDYKYIYHVNGGLENLYDLAADPDELHNIAYENADLCRKCREDLVAYYKSYAFEEALDGDQLVKYEYQSHVQKGI